MELATVAESGGQTVSNLFERELLGASAPEILDPSVESPSPLLLVPCCLLCYLPVVWPCVSMAAPAEIKFETLSPTEVAAEIAWIREHSRHAQTRAGEKCGRS